MEKREEKLEPNNNGLSARLRFHFSPCHYTHSCRFSTIWFLSTFAYLILFSMLHGWVKTGAQKERKCHRNDAMNDCMNRRKHWAMLGLHNLSTSFRFPYPSVYIRSGRLPCSPYNHIHLHNIHLSSCNSYAQRSFFVAFFIAFFRVSYFCQRNHFYC